MTIIENLRLEFRIPISPTSGFYSQVQFFDYSLRRLGPPYNRARLSIYVGDNCDIEAVRRENPWSTTNVVWHAVPSDVFAEFGIHGTADWRLVHPAFDVDLVFLCDADTAFMRDIDPLLASMPTDRPSIRGHMAHFPPPYSRVYFPSFNESIFWPILFDRFNITWPSHLFDYSMDELRRFAQVPAYFNLGFIALNPLALTVLGPKIFEFQRSLMSIMESHMRCQIALTVLTYQFAFDIAVLPASYNAANDPAHFRANYMAASDIRILHYLRTDEIDRSTIFQANSLTDFINRDLSNPANKMLQQIAKEFSRKQLIER